MIVFKLVFALLAIVFGCVMVYFGVSGNTAVALFGAVFTRLMVQAICIVCVAALALLNWRVVVNIFNRATGE